MMNEQREKHKQRLKEIRLDLSHIHMMPNRAYHQGGKRKTVKYFDNNGTFHVERIEDAYTKISGIKQRTDGSFYTCSSESVYLGPHINQTLFMKALSRLCPGDSWSDFLQICSETQFEISNEISFLEKFVGRIESPIFVREPENFNKATFDIVKIDLCLTNITKDIRQTVKDNFDYMTELALEKIEKSRSFQKYGVPINVLRLTNAVITKQLILQLTFELKEF